MRNDHCGGLNSYYKRYRSKGKALFVKDSFFDGATDNQGSGSKTDRSFSLHRSESHQNVYGTDAGQGLYQRKRDCVYSRIGLYIHTTTKKADSNESAFFVVNFTNKRCVHREFPYYS
jgi:hypothetical protein